MTYKYGINFGDRYGEQPFNHAPALVEVCDVLRSDGLGVELWIENYRGSPRVRRAKPDSVFARVVYENAEANQPSDQVIERMNNELIPVLHVAYPSGTSKLFYPLAYRDELPYEGRQWMANHTDCFRLMIDYYGREKGIVVPEIITPLRYVFQQQNYEGRNLFLEKHEEAGWHQVISPLPGDAILTQSPAGWLGGPEHCMALLEGNKILHHYIGRLSCVQDWSGVWKERAVMFLRHESRL